MITVEFFGLSIDCMCNDCAGTGYLRNRTAAADSIGKKIRTNTKALNRNIQRKPAKQK